jgi:phosphoserine phosphatase RsbU/P
MSLPSSEITPVIALKELVANLNRQQKKTHELLSNLGFALRSFKNLNQFLELIPLMIARVTDTAAGGIVLYKKNGQIQNYQFYASADRGCDRVGNILEAASHKITIEGDRDVDFNNDIWPQVEDRLASTIDSQIRYFSSPISMQNGNRGRLYVFTTDPDYQWTLDRQKLLKLVADQTAVAIANDELTSELRRKERLDRELEIGAEIQERLLPNACPNIPGLELAACSLNATHVGGDYYDFIPSNYDRLVGKQADEASISKWSIAIGDVMGKGVPAALIMTMTRGMLRAEVLNGHSPARILQHLNRVMYADLENSSRFVTLFYSEYDPHARTLSFSNAAHNPPRLWQAATETMAVLDTSGMLIGLDPDSQYEQDTIELHTGDTIIYYTDGFTDATDRNGQRFDEKNLLASFQRACQDRLTPQGIIDRIVADIAAFVGKSDRERDDDMTMVIARVTG